MKPTTPDELLARLKASGISHATIAAAIGRSQPVATRLLSGERALKASEIEVLAELLRSAEGATLEAPAGSTVRTRRAIVTTSSPAHNSIEYVPVPILPTFAGMGGGGNGDGDVETALVPRRLIEQELRGRAADFLVINVRGDSMEPDFHHGDQLLVDTRDKNPTQPGPFALQVEGSYLVKNVERVRDGLRLFSSNTKYREEIVSSEDIQLAIIGRPVWFGRKL